MREASIIVTNIYAPNRQTKEMVSSFERFHELAILPNKHEGNGQVIRNLLACYKRAATGHELFAYSDGGDTYCQRKVLVPDDYILYSTEKACYPHEELAKQYTYKGKSPFKYLNGGGYGGPLKLIIEFFEKYGLDKLPNGANGQHEQMIAYLAAKKDGFPIMLDHNCEVFQTTAFTSAAELEIIDKQVHNKLTGTIPAILHGNGTSDMEWIYGGLK